MPGTITSANVTLLLSAPGIFSTPQQIQGFSADDIFDYDMVEWAEVQLGADGQFVGGWVPKMNKQTISLLASSRASFDFFEAIGQAQDQGVEITYLSGFLRYPAISRKYTMYKGVITRGSAAPSAGKVLKMRQFEITWGPPDTGGPAIFGQPL